MGWTAPPYFGETDFYEKKKAKAIQTIIEQVEVIKECDIEIAKKHENKK
jgi:hypothetical protein